MALTPRQMALTNPRTNTEISARINAESTDNTSTAPQKRPRGRAPMNPVLEKWAVCLLLTLAISTLPAPVNSETWKMVSFKNTDSSPILIDTDYLVERGNLVEVRVKGKAEKNPLLFLLPDREVEERYVIDCDANKVAVVYRKTGDEKADIDLVPTSAILADIVENSNAALFAKWACPEHKNQVASRTTSTTASTPVATTSKATSRDTTSGNWGFAAASVDDKERYWIDIDSISVEQGLASFLVRQNLSQPKTEAGVTYVSSTARLSTDCTSQKLASSGSSYYDATGRTVRSDAGSQTKSADVTPGTIARLIYDAACAYARGGDFRKSRIFPKSPTDSSVDLREVPNGSNADNSFLLDVKSITADAKQSMVMVKVVAVRKTIPTDPGTDNFKTYFYNTAIGCEAQIYDNIAVEGFDPFQRMISSDYKTAEQLRDTPIKPGTLIQAVAVQACAIGLGDAKANLPPSTASAKKSDTIGSGTAWYVDSGYVVTAYHVVEGKKRIVLYGVDRKPIAATVVAVDAANDLALLDGAFSERPTIGLSLAKSPAALGSRVFTIGFPHPELLGLSPKYTAGDVSAIAGIGDDPRVFQISVPVQAGNSGGPLINTSGEVVGIVTGKLSAEKVLNKTGDLTQNVNYAIKVRYLQGMIDDLGYRGVRTNKPKGTSISDIVDQSKGAIFLVIVE